jgi:hypothetical protein
MKKLLIFVIVILIIIQTVCGVTNNADTVLNLDFEILENGFSTGWYGINSGNTLNYTVSLESMNVKSGKYSIAIEFTGDSLSSKFITFILPNNYDEEKITLSGYVKTKNVPDGFAGFWMAITHLNGFNIIVRDDEMRITGTDEWKKICNHVRYESGKYRSCQFEWSIYGNGKMWLDGLKLTIDRKEVQQLEPYKQVTFPAENDREFDKGSHIIFPELNKRNICDLELLGRIWINFQLYDSSIYNRT